MSVKRPPSGGHLVFQMDGLYSAGEVAVPGLPASVL